MKMKVNGEYIEDHKFIKSFVCPRCMGTKIITQVYVSANNSIQARCGHCDTYIGCYKYDDNFGGADNATETVSD